MSSYYAYVDKVDSDVQDIFLEFHCLLMNTAGGWVHLRSQQFRNALAESRVPAISLKSSLKRFREQLPGIGEGRESNWYELHTNKEQRGLPADLYADENAAGDAIFVERIEPLSPLIADSLKNTNQFRYSRCSLWRERLQPVDCTKLLILNLLCFF
ncbi:hypothetical protein [Mucilaginibacter boryungensis]|uniref:Uncharacterized protein n=1 Tax=Mucilaginibacter boryungensis TaxID=768480 RepID=A0ABR9XJT2_9SPHI|nr:hypothetical protein [Mucilaginibacter boryungensis]MBE9667638.1 hypothetical protein [Mucilaginibacter boryungensis]